MTQLHRGSCLCGRVHFETRGKLRGIVYCHCSQCRKQSGHFYAATNVQDDSIDISGEENISWYEASEFARRGFCKNCGSVLFWKHKDLDYISVMAGSFDQPSGLQGESHIFVEDKGDYYRIDDDLPKYAKSGGGVVVAADGQD
ncbi:GFA family protein [Phyllobacterium bourgognense]|uniref:GFA family protein n=1 Tax=Phyllobacterium bourgognense TaxID=314236 RepID=UPI000DF3DDF7|nr:GFA family protein [Phyllobacterium bourgognense]